MGKICVHVVKRNRFVLHSSCWILFSVIMLSTLDKMYHNNSFSPPSTSRHLWASVITGLKTEVFFPLWVFFLPVSSRKAWPICSFLISVLSSFSSVFSMPTGDSWSGLRWEILQKPTISFRREKFALFFSKIWWFCSCEFVFLEISK